MAEYEQIHMDTVTKRMALESNYQIVDVRSEQEYESGHIIDAINIPLETIRLSEPKELPDKNQTIFVYCRSGVRSKMASEKLIALGYKKIVEIGGIIDWKGETEVNY